MPVLNIRDWAGYPTIRSLLMEINIGVQFVFSQYEQLVRKSADPLAGVPTELTNTIANLISLCAQADAELLRVGDATGIDVPRWQVYLTDLDTLFRTWWRLPALYGTADDVSQTGMQSSDTMTIARNDTWQSLENTAGVAWADIAQQNQMTGAAEAATDWAGKAITVPRGGTLQVAPIPGVLGSQTGIRVLGRDVSNDMQVGLVECPATFRCRLLGALTDTTIGAVNVSNASGAPTTGGYLRIGDELLTFSTASTENSTITILRRGVLATTAIAHVPGEIVSVVPVMTDLLALDFTDTFIQGLQNALTTASVERVLGGDYGAVQSGIVLVTAIDALKSDPRVLSVSNVHAQTTQDELLVTLDVHSVGRLATHELRLHRTGETR